MASDWIQTLENRKLTPRQLKPEQVGSIDEIAHALAGRFRFSGLTARRYSVAEHCVLGSRSLPPVFAGAFLLHELSEVYLPDIPSPLKPHVFLDVGEVAVAWSDLEREHTLTILKALGLSSIEPLIYSPEVRTMDLAMLAAEKAQLVGPEPEPWGLTVPAAKVDLRVWDPALAANCFLARFMELFR